MLPFLSRNAGGSRGRLSFVYSILVLVLSPVVALECVEWFTHNPWEIMTLRVALWNILFYEMVYLLLFFATGRIRIACILGDLLFFVIGLGNYYVVQFRSTPIVPWDIFSVRTAASVAKDYQYTLTPQAIVCTLLFLLLLVLALFAASGRVKNLPPRLVCCLALLGGLSWYTHTLHNEAFTKSMKLDNTLFTPYYMSRKNGLTTAFLMDLKYMNVQEPDGYSRETEAELLEQVPEEAGSGTPNIIVIMDEAFSDPAVLGDFAVNQDYMPFLHRLQEGAGNVVTGCLDVSVKGGNTANTEWEFLTGNSMRFLPAGSVPYQQYIFGDKPSLVAWLKHLGYTTAAIHPYNASGWNREKIYDYFGFDESLFNRDFTNPSRVRKYIDDASCFRKIMDLYEAKQPNQPLFLFAVTMQNHSGYFEDFDNFDVDVHATDCDSRILDRYLSLMKLTDTALEELLRYFDRQEEDTVVVFFGDHQPNDVVIEPIWKLQGKSSATLTDAENDLRHQVPYLIWANFDLPSAGSGEETSVNYLAGQTLEAAGVPLSPILSYMETLRQDIPVISTQRLTAANGQEITEEEKKEFPPFLAFWRMQYYHMFDEPRDP